MVWSFSRINSFFTCPLGWAKNYIFGEEQCRGFFSDFGLLCHLILEKYFKYELEIWDLVDFYEKQYASNVVTPPPPYPANMDNTYYQRGYEFFSNFEFNRDEYEVIAVEETFYTKIGEYDVVIKPDLRLKNKSTGEVIIFDYKSSDVNKKDEFEKAKLQIHLYALGVLLHHNIRVDKGVVLAIRTGEQLMFNITDDGLKSAEKWLIDHIKIIKQEIDFKKGKPSKYFCDYLCGSRNNCKYREEG